ncbi:MAG: hypothetical protein V1724_01385 [Chloroflexota bacterium]
MANEGDPGVLVRLMGLNAQTRMAVATLFNLNFGIPVFAMRAADVELQALQLIPEETALKYGVLPIRIEDDEAVRFATLTPHDFALSATLCSLLTNRSVRFALALKPNMNQVIKDAYARLKQSEEEKNDWRTFLKSFNDSEGLPGRIKEMMMSPPPTC